ncbi:MAG: c-type cytochrome [Tepidisphaeraceae bacterium]
MTWQLFRAANGRRSAAALCLGLLVACSSSPAGNGGGQTASAVPPAAAAQHNPVAATAESIAAGRTLYAQNCVYCHGDTGKGDGPAAVSLTVRPSDLTSPALGELSDGALFWKISEGHSPMPAHQRLLSSEDRWTVVNYLRTLAPQS